MAARDALALQPHPGEDVAAEAFHQRQSFARAAGDAAERRADRPGRQTRQDLFDQAQALLDLADADPDAGIDVAGLEHRDVELQLIVGRVARTLARVEAAPGRATDIAAGAKLARQFRF